MTQPHSDVVDRIVREVLARLGRTGEKGQGQASPARQTPDGELVVSAPVVSLSAVEDRLEGVRRLVVLPGAVVTPSVRDELRRRNIAVVPGPPRAVGSPGGSKLRSAPQVVMIVLGSRFDPAPLTSALASEGVEVRLERTDCLVTATDTLSAELGKPNTVGLLISTYPAVALCLANRHAGVRAVLGTDASRLGADVASVGANALVLDPKTTGPFQVRQMAVQFCRTQPAECPENLRERLG